jgi:hypothetical protein
MQKLKSISVSNVGQIKRADIEFGDLTVLIGPQATGKSIFLQLLKLVVDKRPIHEELRRFNINWENQLPGFLDLYFGEGMSDIWTGESALAINGKQQALGDYAKYRKSKPTEEQRNGKSEERLFFIPAQRVMSLRDGSTRPFTEYRYGDPFALREFSEKLHQLVQNEFGRKDSLFPQNNRLNATLRAPIAKHIFGDFGLKTSAVQSQKRIVLGQEGKTPLPYLVWSAGQREFVPLLLGFYWLMPPAKVSRREKLEWVVIEELEMGLHPNAISAVLSLVMELLSRGYKVCLSTHSPHVLDVIWALQFMKDHQGNEGDVLSLFELKANASSNKLAANVLKKIYKVYFFERGGVVKDISRLDPGSEDSAESGWGGLSGFSGHVADVVSKVANRNEKVTAG